MPHLIAAALIGAGVLAGLRFAQKFAAILKAVDGAGDATTGRPTTGQVEARDLGALEYDPVSGVYKPAPAAR